MSTAVPQSRIEYPDRDGQPMSDDTLQFDWIVRIKEGLEVLFRDDPNVFIAGDLLWYPVEGQPKIRSAPDALVAFGRPKGRRGSYMQWVEGGIAPQVVFEVLSHGNRPREMKAKLDFYETYGAEEYYRYDPDHIRLRGWLRQGDRLVSIPVMNGWISPRLGIRFELSADDLTILGPDGKPFLTSVEEPVTSTRSKNARSVWRPSCERSGSSRGLETPVGPRLETDSRSSPRIP